MITSPMLVYAVSLLASVLALLCIPLRKEPLQLRWVTPSPRDFTSVGIVLLGLACYSAVALSSSFEIESISQILRGRHAGSSSVLAGREPAAFALNVYAHAVVGPLLLALGLRLIAYGRQLRPQL